MMYEVDRFMDKISARVTNRDVRYAESAFATTKEAAQYIIDRAVNAVDTANLAVYNAEARLRKVCKRSLTRNEMNGPCPGAPEGKPAEAGKVDTHPLQNKLIWEAS